MASGTPCDADLVESHRKWPNIHVVQQMAAIRHLNIQTNLRQHLNLPNTMYQFIICVFLSFSISHSSVHPSSSSRDRVLSSTQFSEIDLDHPTAHHPAHSRQASCAWTSLGMPLGAVHVGNPSRETTRICLETMLNTWRNQKTSQNSDVGPSLPSAPMIYTQKRTCCHRASRTLHCAKRRGRHPTFRRSTSWWDPVFQLVLFSHLATNVNRLSLARLATHSHLVSAPNAFTIP